MRTKPLTKDEVRDIQEQAMYRVGDATSTAPKNDTFGACVGTMAAAVLAAAGATLCDAAGRIACETDYLAISGATFPASVTVEQMEDFNRRTLKPDMTEEDERRRYEKIADFFHGKERT